MLERSAMGTETAVTVNTTVPLSAKTALFAMAIRVSATVINSFIGLRGVRGHK